jgi:DNA repair protein RecN (Recombination protein N)
MLRSLSVRDVVLIGHLDLAFQPGLSVLTGETGAGKSILLDALGLALGVRAEAKLVRHGAGQASVAAEFDAEAPGLLEALAEHGLAADDGAVILRRVLTADGRSRAFVNDQAVSVSLLRALGERLVEIHGEFESQRLLSPAFHRDLLDSFAGHSGVLDEVAARFRERSERERAAAAAEADLARSRSDEEYLRHAAAELEALDPRPGEEAALAERRAVMMHGERIVEALNQAAAELAAGKGAEATLQAARRHLERVRDKAEGRLDGVISQLARAAAEAAEAAALVERTGAGLAHDAASLDNVEERLFRLRAAARKHATGVDALPDLRRELQARLADLEDGGHAARRLREEAGRADAAYREAAARLSRARRAASARLDAAVRGELAPMKLEQATFATRIEPLPEAEWDARGGDRLAFEVATNPGVPPGPLHRIASAGELSRFMLALETVLAEAQPTPTIVFDEVDAGIGGATAAAVGARLARLARRAQVLVVTHSPQVAAVGSHHWRVDKVARDGAVLTTVERLHGDARNEEIARMLAGARVTEAARAAAKSLIAGGTAGA